MFVAAMIEHHQDVIAYELRFIHHHISSASRARTRKLNISLRTIRTPRDGSQKRGGIPRSRRETRDAPAFS